VNRPDLSQALRAILDCRLDDVDDPGHRHWLRFPARGSKLAISARVELARVHARELAYLLREAARLRHAADPCARHWRWVAREPGTLAAWRRSFTETLALIARDRCITSFDLAELCERCRAPELADWPAAVELADAALALAPEECGRLERAVAALLSGDARRAATTAALELAAWPPPRADGEFLLVLACAAEAQGRLAEAVALYDLSLPRIERTSAAVHAAAHMLYLALAVGARKPALRAADALVRGANTREFDGADFERCTRELCTATIARRGAGSFGVHPRMERQFLRFTAAAPAVVRRVAAALG
jgi:hypothetical protein